MYSAEVAEIFAKGFMAGRRDGDAKEKAIEAAIKYIKPKSEGEEQIIRFCLGREL